MLLTHQGQSHFCLCILYFSLPRTQNPAVLRRTLTRRKPKSPRPQGDYRPQVICAPSRSRDSNGSGFIGCGGQRCHPTQSVTSRDVRKPLVGLGQGLFKVEKEGSQCIISVASTAGHIIVLLLSIPVWGIFWHF